MRDPAEPAPVETRLLIDGRPLVPEAFCRGFGHSPEYRFDAADYDAEMAGPPHPVGRRALLGQHRLHGP